METRVRGFRSPSLCRVIIAPQWDGNSDNFHTTPLSLLVIIAPQWDGNSKTMTSRGIDEFCHHRTTVGWKRIGDFAANLNLTSHHRTTVGWKLADDENPFAFVAFVIIAPQWDGNFRRL